MEDRLQLDRSPQRTQDPLRRPTARLTHEPSRLGLTHRSSDSLPLDGELSPLARADRRVELLDTIPGIGALLGLTIASEIGDVSRFANPRKLVGYAGLAPKVHQSGQSSRSGDLSKAGSRSLRWAAVEAAQGAWRETNPWHRLYVDVKRRNQNKSNPAKAAVARKLLIACWHVLSRNEPFTPSRTRGGDPVPASSSAFLAA